MNSSSSASTTFTNRPQPPPPPPPPPPSPPPPPPSHSPSPSPSPGFLPPVHQLDPPLPPPLLSHNPKQKLPHHFRHSHHHSSKPFFPLPSASTPPKPKPRKKPDPSSSFSSSKTTTPPCTECGKRFSSWKALFGHMRCHPERQWRGINPPPHLRRSAATDRFTDEEYEVASSLLLLSRGPPKDVCCAVPCAAERCDHKCNVCSRGFSTGQALGGHKRCHWEKGGGGEEGGVECSSRNYDLDLNLPAPLESNEGNASSVLDLRLGI